MASKSYVSVVWGEQKLKQLYCWIYFLMEWDVLSLRLRRVASVISAWLPRFSYGFLAIHLTAIHIKGWLNLYRGVELHWWVLWLLACVCVIFCSECRSDVKRHKLLIERNFSGNSLDSMDCILKISFWRNGGFFSDMGFANTIRFGRGELLHTNAISSIQHKNWTSYTKFISNDFD